MKILLIVLGLLVALILIIVVIGAMLPKRHTATRTALIKATPERVFALISGSQEWRTDLKSSESFVEGGRHLRREVYKNGQKLTTELVESRPPWFLKGKIVDNPQFGGSWTFRVEQRQETCSVTITEDGEVYNPVFRFVSRFIIGHTRTIDNYLVMLSAAAESRK
jgi:hypothetical protein